MFNVKKYFLDILLLVCVPVAGAMGYVHGTFVTKEVYYAKVKSVELNTNAIHNTFDLVCGIAIKLKLDNAEEICTNRQGEVR